MSDYKLDIRFTQENDGYLFSVMRASGEARRKKGSWRISFFEHGAQRLLNVPQSARMREYCESGGEFSFEHAAKAEKLYAHGYQFFIPFKLFLWMEQGTRFLLRVELLGDNVAEPILGVLPLMISVGGKLMQLSEENYLAYLVSFGSIKEKMDFADKYLEVPGAGNCGPVLEMLTGLARTEQDGEAEYLLYRLYSDPARIEGDEALAKDWLDRAAEKKNEKALRTMGAVPAMVEVKAGSIEEYMAQAEGGNSAAQYKLYEYYMQKGDHFDPKKALEQLTRAAENGNNLSVERLEKYFLNSYLVDAGAEHFLSLCKKSAEAGSSTACIALFEAYHSGSCLNRTVKRDKRLALFYLKKAADMGDQASCYRMWQLFEDGNELLSDEKDAVARLQKAAEAGNARALCDFGELYVTGRIVEKDGARGIEMIRRSADLGSYGAQMRVYRMTYDGRYHDILLDIDHKRAGEILIDFAKECGNPIAQTELWNSYLNSNPLMLTRPEALGYLSAAAGQDYVPAMVALADIDLMGVYKDIDLKEGNNLLERGAKMGSPDAQFSLYELFYTGSYGALHCRVNKERAYQWIARSAVRNPVAQYRMWEMFSRGNEMGLEDKEAYDLLFSSVRAGCNDARYAAAVLFAKGEAFPPDVEKAVRYLTLAAHSGHARSMYKLYEVYSKGCIEKQEVRKDDDLARRMLLLSAQRGYQPACSEVCRMAENGIETGTDNTFVAECRARLGNQTDTALIRSQVASAQAAAPALTVSAQQESPAQTAAEDEKKTEPSAEASQKKAEPAAKTKTAPGTKSEPEPESGELVLASTTAE